MPRLHVQDGRPEPEVVEELLESTRQRPAKPSRAPRDDPIHIRFDGRQEILTAKARLVVDELGQRFERNARLVRANQAVKIVEGWRFAVEPKMREETIGR